MLAQTTPITLKWQYTNGVQYEYSSRYSEKIGQLYGIKLREPDIAVVQVWHDGNKVLEWKAP